MKVRYPIVPQDALRKQMQKLNPREDLIRANENEYRYFQAYTSIIQRTHGSCHLKLYKEKIESDSLTIHTRKCEFIAIYSTVNMMT